MKISPDQTKKERRILVIKHGALGDMVQAMDAFASLRAAHRSDHLAVLTSPPFAGLLTASPYFDEVLLDDRAPIYRMGSWLRMRRLFRSGWTRIYDFQCSSRTNRYFKYFIASTGIEFVGAAKGVSHPIPNFEGVNNRDRMLMTASLGGVAPAEANLDWLGGGRTLLTDLCLPRPYAILLPGCSPAKPSKRWSAAGYVALATGLMDQGITPVLAGTKHDAAAVDEITQMLPEITSILGQTTIDQLCQVCRGAAAVIGNDTGPVFLAARMGAPTVMVMGADTDPTMSAPIGDKASWVRAEPIDKVEPADVLNALKQLMA